MLKTLKHTFKHNTKCTPNFKLTKTGNKIYTNTLTDIYHKKFYKTKKNIIGYNYILTLHNFNMFFVKLTILDKKNRQYVNFHTCFNIFNNKMLFLN